MSANVSKITPLEITPKVRLAARMVADERLTMAKIAEEIGVCERTLLRWKATPEFAGEVARLREAMLDAVLAEGIADKRWRLQQIRERHDALRQIVAERKADPALADVPGGTTGHVVQQVRFIKVYLDQDGHVIPSKQVEQITEYSVDTSVLESLRKLEADAAAETGGRVAKSETTVHRDAELNLDALSDEELDEYYRLTKLAEAGAE